MVSPIKPSNSDSDSEYNAGYKDGFNAAVALYRQNNPIKILGNIQYNTSNQTITYKDVPIKLTRTHRTIMELLITGRIISKASLYSWLWPMGDDKSHEILSCHICNLRKRLITAGCPNNIIQTRHGEGWQLNLI